MGRLRSEGSLQRQEGLVHKLVVLPTPSPAWPSLSGGRDHVSAGPWWGHSASLPLPTTLPSVQAGRAAAGSLQKILDATRVLLPAGGGGCGWPWVSAESCSFGAGLRKGAVLKALPFRPTASRHLETQGRSRLVVDSGLHLQSSRSVTRWHLVTPLRVNAVPAQGRSLLTQPHASWALWGCQERGGWGLGVSALSSTSLSGSPAGSGSLALCEIRSELPSLAFRASPDLTCSHISAPPMIQLVPAPRPSLGLPAQPIPQPERPFLPSLLSPTPPGPA